MMQKFMNLMYKVLNRKFCVYDFKVLYKWVLSIRNLSVKFWICQLKVGDVGNFCIQG